VFAGGQKLPSSTRRKNANADRPVRFKSKFISPHGWLAQGKYVFGCGRSVPGIDFVAASGFNDVSSTGILTYS
jgi:hypothetical protein